MQVPDFVSGAIAPVFTAFNEDGTLDDAGQRNLMDYMVQAGGVSFAIPQFLSRGGLCLCPPCRRLGHLNRECPIDCL